ncbi:hypothetical protein ZWY2020_023147 [Hordeum vulgare]|nr:hypothetical protein ZWY2020_023147 [Hordeum vulgare]
MTLEYYSLSQLQVFRYKRLSTENQVKLCGEAEGIAAVASALQVVNASLQKIESFGQARTGFKWVVYF